MSRQFPTLFPYPQQQVHVRSPSYHQVIHYLKDGDTVLSTLVEEGAMENDASFRHVTYKTPSEEFSAHPRHAPIRQAAHFGIFNLEHQRHAKRLRKRHPPPNDSHDGQGSQAKVRHRRRPQLWSRTSHPESPENSCARMTEKVCNERRAKLQLL